MAPMPCGVYLGSISPGLAGALCGELDLGVGDHDGLVQALGAQLVHAAQRMAMMGEWRWPPRDYRGREWALTCKDKTQRTVYSFSFWWDWVVFCRRNAAACGVSMRTLDRAMWQWSNERGR